MPNGQGGGAARSALYLGAGSLAALAAAWPERAITLLHGFPPGRCADIARWSAAIRARGITAD
jgi:hypothetical protein